MSGNLIDSYMEKLVKLVKEIPNDMELGKEIRNLLNNLPDHLKKRYS